MQVVFCFWFRSFQVIGVAELICEWSFPLVYLYVNSFMVLSLKLVVYHFLYIITQVILAFWLVLAYDLLEVRRIDDDSARFNFFEFFEFWIWTNHNSLLSIATNQFGSFCIDIRSCQCYFRVCQSGEIWNKKAFFTYILIFLLYKTNRQQWHTRLRLVCHFFVLTTFWRHLWSITEQTHGNMESICLIDTR